MNKAHILIKGLVISSAIFFNLAPIAQAASFTTNFTQTNGSKGDIWLNSITQNQVTFNNFLLVNQADILYNSPITDRQSGDTSNPNVAGRINNTGAASTDKGDLASAPLPVSGLNDPTGTEIAAYLGNLNLNNIIDTEDQGSSKINVFFDQVVRADQSGLDNVFFWERGMNSDLGIQAIDANGNLIGQFLKLNRAAQSDAGYSIDTTEISSAMPVGVWGVSLQELGVSSLYGLQLTMDGSYNGPDYKLLARQVPEPTALAGLGVVMGSLFFSRRRQLRKAS
jgi:hypothetical protein